jgi:hypothetical protein
MPALAAAEARQIVEIGAEFGGMTQLLAEFADHAGGRLTSIDPAPKPEFVEWLKGQSSVTHVPRLSLEAIPEQRDVDAWIVDGDHNWFTVYHECHAIGEAARRDGKPLLVFFTTSPGRPAAATCITRRTRSRPSSATLTAKTPAPGRAAPS